jgi:hypothetical protein
MRTSSRQFTCRCFPSAGRLKWRTSGSPTNACQCGPSRTRPTGGRGLTNGGAPEDPPGRARRRRRGPGDRVPTGVLTKRDCTAIRRSRPQMKAIATYRVHELVE